MQGGGRGAAETVNNISAISEMISDNLLTAGGSTEGFQLSLGLSSFQYIPFTVLPCMSNFCKIIIWFGDQRSYSEYHPNYELRGSSINLWVTEENDSNLQCLYSMTSINPLCNINFWSSLFSSMKSCHARLCPDWFLTLNWPHCPPIGGDLSASSLDSHVSVNIINCRQVC